MAIVNIVQFNQNVTKTLSFVCVCVCDWPVQLQLFRNAFVNSLNANHEFLQENFNDILKSIEFQTEKYPANISTKYQHYEKQQYATIVRLEIIWIHKILVADFIAEECKCTHQQLYFLLDSEI